jgi:hypothetical protein
MIEKLEKLAKIEGLTTRTKKASPSPFADPVLFIVNKYGALDRYKPDALALALKYGIEIKPDEYGVVVSAGLGLATYIVDNDREQVYEAIVSAIIEKKPAN